MKVVELQRGYWRVGKFDTVLAARDGLRCWNCNRRACKHSAAVMRFLARRAADGERIKPSVKEAMFQQIVHLQWRSDARRKRVVRATKNTD